MKRYREGLAFGVLVSLVIVAPALAEISYPDGAGMDFTWQNAEDDNGYFGMPVASTSSNLIYFPLSSFLAEADGVQQSDTAADQLRMDITANSGLLFESVTFVAQGTYEIVAGQIGDASVEAAGNVTLSTLAGQPLDAGADSASYVFFADAPTTGSVAWGETLSVTIPFSNVVSSLHVVADQRNTAIAADGTSSILTNFQIIGIELGVRIPEPASLTLLLVGGLFVIRRQR